MPVFRLGLDIGGTFTDLVALNEATGELHSIKLPSTPQRPAEGVRVAVQQMLASEPAARIRTIVHATTLAANALLGQTGLRLPKAALVTTCGFRDVLEIARQRRPELYNLFFRRPPPLVPRRHRYEVDERLGPQGQVWRPLRAASVRRVARELRAARIETVAIALLHSYANSAHEAAVAKELQRRMPALDITTSHRVAPEYREYERTSTTVVHAVLRPLLARYVQSIRRNLRRQGTRAPLYLMQSNGGIADYSVAEALPGSLVESGPAAGVIGAAYFGHRLGHSNILSFDMGGTTAKAGIIHRGRPALVTEYEVGGHVHAGRVVKGSGYPVRFSFLDLAECGAGGGTIAHVDNGALRVGPLSAGAEPGPACYDHGGTRPTVTDAHLVLGRLPRTSLLGGKLPLNTALAEAAITEHVARPLRLKVSAAAAGIVQVINATMTKILRMVSIERGHDPREFTLLTFGGAGPMHACALATELDMRRVVVPPHPGLFSAYGLLVADFTHSLVRSVLARLDTLTEKALEQWLDALVHEGRGLLAREGFRPSEIVLHLAGDLRYRGQGHELTVPLAAPTGVGWRDEIARRFHRQHRQVYGFAAPEPIELVSLRLTAIGRVKPHANPPPVAGKRAPVPFTRHGVYFEEGGEVDDCPIYDRPQLGVGVRLDGPAVITQYDATTVLPPKWHASADATGALLLER